ncbi:hypothetical protein [Methylobacterium sp. yr668]|uniref:hypothetical protein n=1 Tax=Methylobacterium sp. yr668 TaxID=1761801 RepID=UPI000B852BD0|nr:hypothetical protein [Methylobacterium sp. yr668]
MVRLKRSLDLGDGRHMPAGSLGAIVFVHGGGAAYEVEFAKPTHAVVTVPAAGVARAIVAG